MSCSSGSNVDLHEPASDDLVRETSATTSMAAKFLEQMNKNDQHENKSDLCKYLSDTLVKEADPFDILNWWKTNSSKYLVLSEMARNVLSVPVSTVASESAFSTEGRILDSYRSSLRPKTVEALVCAQNWLRSKESMPDLRDVISELDSIEEIANEYVYLNIDDDLDC
ncbi:HAT dimerization [Heracleum sosnowskyi]|uniref:HAT dimerization n=1 Tax=Heracleum sosnowskyi TaxID=360622 RepID=A0AAD8I4W8_9APIA|nr:HAT dimerization [Heracleum sosnowskyi]